MAETADVVVIGGGIIGTSIAYNLAKRGAGKVLLLEKYFIAAGATGKSSAIVRQHYSHPITARMAAKSLEIFRNFDDVVGGECGYRNVGFLVSADAASYPGLKRNVEMMQRLGIKTTILSPAEIKELVPQFNTADIVAGAYEPEGGYCDGALTANAYANAAKRLGAVVRTRTGVKRILHQSGRVTGVETEQGEVIAAPVVVNSAGGNAMKLARELGMELPVVNIRHPICTFRRPSDFAKPHPVYGDFINQIYFRPEGEMLTIVGTISHEHCEHNIDPDNYYQGVEPEMIARISERLIRRVPAMADALSIGGYSGFYDVSQDEYFILDKVPGVEGAYVTSGMSGHGFKHGPVIGEMMADFILHGASKEFDIREFRFSRFAEGKLFGSSYEFATIG